MTTTYCLKLACTILLLWLQLSIAHGSNTSHRSQLAAKQSIRQELLFSSQRKACGFYVWNVVSAGLHGLCERLCRDCKYEGRGGREFMLIPPGSLLQLLYPCNQYSPDKCLWCGGSHADHVVLAWSKRYLYSPYDLMLDRVTKEATTRKEIKVWKDVPPDIKTTYGFHKRYVVDIDAPQRNVKKDREGKAVYDPSRMSATKSFGVRYLLPRCERPHVSRLLVMSQLNHLIELQELQNKVLELKQYGEYSRRNFKRLRERHQRMH